jgi:hypothetical protein
VKKKPKKRTRLDIQYDRQDHALIVLFAAGFAPWEISALLRRSEGMVVEVLRKAVR